MLQADIDQIKALAGTLDNVAANVDAIDVRSPAKAVSPGLPGTPLGAACELATEYTEGAWLRASQRIGQVSTAMKQAATELAVTDEEFKQRLDTLDFHAGGAR